MVSTSDTAKQIQFSSMKQDAAEAAFKARHSFGSSDAFKQIFDRIDQCNKPVEPPKDVAAEPVKAEGPVKVHKHNHKHHGKPEDKSDKHADCDMKEKCTDDNDADTIKPVKASDKNLDAKKVKNKTRDEDDDCHFDKCEQSATDAANTIEPKAAAAAETTDCVHAGNGDGEHCVNADNAANDQLVESEETTEIVANDASFVEATPAPVTDTATLLGVPEVSAPLIASLQPNLSDDGGESVAADIKSTIPVVGDLQKPVGPDQKSTSEKPVTQTATPTSDSQDADDVLSASIEVETESAQELQPETQKAGGLSKHDLFHAAKEKHAEHLDLLQGKFSAPETHPAAGDRAISAAQTAPDSPAPTPNGSAGGGSPITTKTATSTVSPTIPEGMHAVKGEQVSFSGVLHSTKEVHASAMLPGEQVAVHLNRMARTGMSQYELHLHPAELGRVDIRLEIAKDGTVQATVTADNQQTFDMLQKDSRSLERALQQAGLQTDSGSLSFNLRGDNQSLAQQQAQYKQGGPWNKWTEKTLPEEAIQSKVLSFDVGTGNGRVDLRI